jgi:hypothetical protein
VAFARCSKCRGGTPTGERAAFSARPHPFDADGRIRVCRRLAFLYLFCLLSAIEMKAGATAGQIRRGRAERGAYVNAVGKARARRRRENEILLRHCEPSEAIQFRAAASDCFVAELVIGPATRAGPVGSSQ